MEEMRETERRMRHAAETVHREAQRLLRERGKIIIAVDGRCAAGKSTLAAGLGDVFGGNVFHMDDFFLRPEQRTEKRYEEPGGNVDRERFLSEVLCPLFDGRDFTYRPFDCHRMELSKPLRISATEVSIVEGTYSCHPALRDSYDLRVFLTTTPERQLERIRRRNGADLRTFRERWIPLEERYFLACGVEDACELKFET